MSHLETSILKTVAYFDIFDYPLTAFEIWQYLDQPTSLLSVQKALESESLSLETKHGFFFLPNREELISIRQERYKITDKKIKKLRLRLSLIQWLPGIRLICLANSIGSHNLRATSDNDLFIVTKKNQLWWVKLWSTLILKCAGLRPTARKSADRLCLSFLIDETALNLSSCRQDISDTYFTYWLTGLVPLYGDINVYHNLIKANSWLSTALPNWQIEKVKPPYRFTRAPHPSHIFSFISERCEKVVRKLQMRVMPDMLSKSANQSSSVIVSDSVLKLHAVDRRTLFQAEYNKRLTSLNLI